MQKLLCLLLVAGLASFSVVDAQYWGGYGGYGYPGYGYGGYGLGGYYGGYGYPGYGYGAYGGWYGKKKREVNAEEEAEASNPRFRRFATAN